MTMIYDEATTPKRARLDLRVEGGGTVYLLRPLSQRGRRWVRDHIEAGALTFGGAIAVEHRFIADIVTGARADGLEVG